MMGIEYRQVANHSIARQKVHQWNPKRILSPEWRFPAASLESVWWMFDGTLWWQSLRGSLRVCWKRQPMGCGLPGNWGTGAFSSPVTVRSKDPEISIGFQELRRNRWKAIDTAQQCASTTTEGPDACNSQAGQFMQAVPMKCEGPAARENGIELMRCCLLRLTPSEIREDRSGDVYMMQFELTKNQVSVCIHLSSMW